MKSSPCSPQLEKARVQQRRPNAAKNKYIYLKKPDNQNNFLASPVFFLGWFLDFFVVVIIIVMLLNFIF